LKPSRPHTGLRSLALLGSLLSSSCTQPTSESAGAFPQADLPRCALPKPVIDRTFIVFFDRHRDELTGRAKTILQELADYSERERLYDLRIYGHSDASEIKGGDRGVGGRRAAKVRDFLKQAGVRDDIMTTRDVGPNQPLVRTEPGRPEPQNRFVMFRYRGYGSLEQAAERKACLDWLQRTYCEAPANKRTQQACTTALRSL
jgi:outer membrane protein OmpA-like peptidoglycan-associated protein